MVYSEYKQQRIVFWHLKGLKAPSILKKMTEEGLACSRQGIYNFLVKYRATGTTARKIGSRQKTKVVEEVKDIIEGKMQEDDETTAVQLQEILRRQGHRISLSTILRCRKSLGWTHRGSAYCQMIREANKAKRLSWAREHVNDEFKDVI
jgi:transposase